MFKSVVRFSCGLLGILAAVGFLYAKAGSWCSHSLWQGAPITNGIAAALLIVYIVYRCLKQGK